MFDLRAILLILALLVSTPHQIMAYDIGVYYYPGWKSDHTNWNDIKGIQGSRSPNRSWPEREPLLGHYAEEEMWVAEKHIDWAASHGIDLFVYDWYWDGERPEFDHAINNYLKSSKREKIKFCLLWANNLPVPENMKQYDDMIKYWIDNYFNKSTFYKINEKPVVFIFSINQLDLNASKMGSSTASLLKRAQEQAQKKGYKGIYFVATINEIPDDSLEKRLREKGFSAYSGWNYVVFQGARHEDYDRMVEAYEKMYQAALNTDHLLPYIVPASPGYDERPWQGDRSWVSSNPTPEKFARMLKAAKKTLDQQKDQPKILLIEAWNEFGEGSYIEPTKKWGFQYLEVIQKIFPESYQ